MGTPLYGASEEGFDQLHNEERRLSVMSIYDSVIQLLREKEQFLEILKTIIAYEEEHQDDQYFDSLGWEWSDVQVAPWDLMTLWRRGILKIVYKSRKHTGYLLADREETKRAVTDFENLLQEIEVVTPQEEEIPEDLFENIIGYDDVKDIFRRALSSEKPVHILLIGPPASAKTMFLLELERLPNSYFALGSRASKAGLASILIERRPRYLLINEFDQLSREDYGVLLSLAQYGIVSETLYGRVRSVRLKTWIFATANETKGIPEQVLSRFLQITFQRYNREQFIKTVEHVLVRQENVEPELARKIALAVYDELDSADPREAIRIARLVKSEEELEHIIKVLKKYRQTF